MSIIKDIEAHPAYIRQLRRAGGMAVQAKHDEQPSVDAGLFDYPVWAADKEYSAGDLFMYDSKPGLSGRRIPARIHGPLSPPARKACMERGQGSGQTGFIRMYIT